MRCSNSQNITEYTTRQALHANVILRRVRETIFAVEKQ